MVERELIRMDDHIICQKNMVYGETEKEYLTADIFKPDVQSEELLPILVLIHGGGFQAGSKEMYTDWGMVLAKEGYFVMALNYRLSNPSTPSYPGVFDDIEKAMNWLVFNANKWKLDVERIGIIGDSAGAYLASTFVLKNSPFSYRICSVVGVYGIYDLVDECLNPINDRKDNIYECFLGKSFKGNLKMFREASPTFYINDAVSNPTFDTQFLLIYGEKDKTVNPEQSRKFALELKKASIYVEAKEIKDVGHFWFNKLPRIEGGTLNHYPNNIVYPKIIEFLNKTVLEVPSGNFSNRQIQVLKNIEKSILTQNC